MIISSVKFQFFACLKCTPLPHIANDRSRRELTHHFTGNLKLDLSFNLDYICYFVSKAVFFFFPDLLQFKEAGDGL